MPALCCEYIVNSSRELMRGNTRQARKRGNVPDSAEFNSIELVVIWQEKDTMDTGKERGKYSVIAIAMGGVLLQARRGWYRRSLEMCGVCMLVDSRPAPKSKLHTKCPVGDQAFLRCGELWMVSW